MFVFGHRGYFDRSRAENTLEAFQEAIRRGADGVEFDVRVSKDGELVLVHDANLHRIAGDAHKVTELTAEELARLPLRHGGSIVTLNEVTAQIHAPTQLDIEVKHRDAVEPVIRKLQTSSALRERSVVSSFHASVLQRVQFACPDVRTLLLIPRWPLPLRGERLWQRVRKLAPWGVAMPITILNASRVAYLRQFGQVGSWDMRFTATEAHACEELGLDFAILHCVDLVSYPPSAVL